MLKKLGLNGCSMRRRIRAVVTWDERGQTLGDLLVRHYPFKNLEQWRVVAVNQQVMVNGRAEALSLILKPDDEVVYEAPESPEPAVDFNFTVLFEDEEMLVINKSGNLPCHPSGCYHDNTLWYKIKDRFGLLKPHLINRLDRETSGIVLVAKTREAARNLSGQFSRRCVKKVYAVIVEGAFPCRLEATGWLLPDQRSVVRKKRCFVRGSPDEEPSEKAEWSESCFELMQKHGDISLVRVQPHTGRLHQIRATLCSLGFPVVGDKLYGVDDKLFLKFISGELNDADKTNLRMERQALHAQELHISHPVTGEQLCFTASLPEDMDEVWC